MHDGDAEQLTLQAHSLRGSSAPTMARIVRELEQTGDSGDFEKASELLGDLEQEFGHVRPALQSIALHE